MTVQALAHVLPTHSLICSSQRPYQTSSSNCSILDACPSLDLHLSSVATVMLHKN